MVAVSLKKKSSRRRHKGRAEDGIRDVERSRCFFFQAEDGIRDVERSRGLGDVYKRQNQLLAEWDPYTLPIIAERNGYVKYLDLKQGISFRESIDDTTGISSKIVIDWSQNQKSKNFKPAINIVDNLSDDKIVEANLSNYPMSIDSILSVEDGQEVYALSLIHI